MIFPFSKASTHYVIAIVSSVAAMLLSYLSTPWFGNLRFFFYYPVTMVLAATLGARPAILALILSNTFLFVSGPKIPIAIAQLVFFTLANIVAIYLLNASRRAQDRERRVMRRMTGVTEENIRLGESLQQHEERFRVVSETFPLGLFVTDQHGACQYVNPQYQRISGLSFNDSLGEGWIRAIHPEDRQRVFDTWQANAGQMRTYESEHRFLRPDGSVIWTHVRAAPIAMRGGITGYVGAVEDITQQRALDSALRASEEKYRLASNAGRVGIWDWDILKDHVTWSERIYEFHGLQPGDFDGTVAGFSRLVYPEDREQVETRLKKALNDRMPFRMEFRTLRPDGALRWLTTDADVVCDASGLPVRMLGATIDITDRKQSEGALARLNENLERQVAARTDELLKKEAELQQTRKMEALGRLAGGIAHDFNNLITGIIGVTEELKRSFADDDLRREDTDEIIKASNRAFAVTRQLLAFSRRQVVRPQLIDVNAAVLESHKLLKRLLGEDIKLQVDLGEVSPVLIDPSQFGQIILNLAINARDAMPEGGTILLSTEEMTIDGAWKAKSRLQAPPGPYVLLQVKDSGHGMTPDVLEHIFEPFFTTKDKEKGTGLGLATVYGIVKQNGGDIAVETTPGQGTAFKVLFPKAQLDVHKPADTATVVQPPGGRETLLVVEDGPIVRRVVVRLLKKAGYAVLEAGHGREALNILRHQKAGVDLLLPDVVMPEMNGRQLALEAKRVQSDLKTLYMSGYPEDIIASRGILDPGVDFIDKSSLQTGLLRRVRDVLDGRGTTN